MLLYWCHICDVGVIIVKYCGILQYKICFFVYFWLKFYKI